MSELVVLERDTITDQRMELYLTALESGEPTMSSACRAARISRQTIYKWRKLDGFLAMENQAKQTGNDVVLEAIRQRGVHGDAEVMTDHRGNIVYVRNLDTGEYELDENFEKIPMMKRGKKSDRLLELEARIRGMVPGAGGGGGVAIELEGGAVPTKITVNFVGAPDWDKADDPNFWTEDGRPNLKNITPVQPEPVGEVIEGEFDFLDA